MSNPSSSPDRAGSIGSAQGGSASSPGKARLPPAIANASREELQKLCLDTLKKLKAKDARVKELTEENRCPWRCICQSRSWHLSPATAVEKTAPLCFRGMYKFVVLEATSYATVCIA